MQEGNSSTPLGSTGSARSPVATADGRPYRADGDAADELALWLPESPRDGDAVYCQGVRIGTFHGDYSKPGEWYVETLPTEELPPGLAERLQGQAKNAAADKQD
jgi:hypothetical protein